MRQLIRFLILVWLVSSILPGMRVVAEAQRGLSLNNVEVTNPEGEPILLYQESHALIIGISNYPGGWPVLPGVQQDVREVKAALEEHGFNVEVEMDLDKTGIEDAFNTFINRYGQAPNNRLLFYFAGHGHTVRMSYGEEIGYIVPVDAPNPNKHLPLFQSKAIDMQRIEYFAKRIQSKHALFLFDACFSGSLFALSRAIPDIITYKTAQPVRQFITSGSADETVPDESIFRAQFIRALQGEADSDTDGYLTGTELGEFLQTTVVNYSRNSQHPQYGKIRNPNLDKGDFVFNIRKQEEEEVLSDMILAPPEVTVSFDDIDAQLKWQAYLQDMEATFTKLLNYEQLDFPPQSKIAAWTRFLQAYSADNPFSPRDEELRERANEKIRILQERGTPSDSQLIVSSPDAAEIEALLKQADDYFDKKWFLTPEESNAYDTYRAVLQHDPKNRHAREQLYAMIDTYKTWADTNYEQARYDKAQTFYERQLTIVRYLIEDLGELSLIPEFERVRERLQGSGASVPALLPAPTPIPMPTLLPIVTPTPIMTPTPPPYTPKTWVEPTTGMKFVWIEGGCFQMGSPADEVGRSSSEGPVHEVCLDGFWIGQVEVTQEQWQRLMGENPANLKAPNHPVEQVSWNDVQRFLRELTRKAGQGSYRLPSEAEWEYAARAGTTTMYSFGDDTAQVGQYAWFKENAQNQTHPIGQLQPNPWGLYDMHGNVWEWTADPSHNNYAGAPSDGRVWETGADTSVRILRGGSWGSHPWGLRSANRLRNKPDYKNNSIGFRIVRVSAE